MATTDRAALAPLSRAEVAGLATVWPKAQPVLALQVIETMHLLSLRHLSDGGLAALSTVMAAHGLPVLPQPRRSSGTEPRLIWSSLSETLLLTHNAAQAAALLAALRPAPGALACALDMSAGTLVVMLQGRGVDALLSRTFDASAQLCETGQASRMRLADVAAVVWREAPDRVGLLVDRANDHYLARWLSYAAEAIDVGSAGR